MGKALIIRGADFSANAIENLPLDGKIHLTEADAFTTKVGYIETSNDKWAVDTTGYYSFFSLKAGDLFVAKNKTGVKMGLVFLDELPVSNAVVDYAFDKNNSYFNLKAEGAGSCGSDFVFSGIVSKDCIVGIQTTTDGGSNVFPYDVYTMDADNIQYPRVFTENNYDWYVYNLYYASNKKWQSSTPTTDNKPNGVFYNLYKGETLHIEAQDGVGCGYAIFYQSAYPAGAWNAERQLVEAGGSVDIPITEEFTKIWIFRQEGSNNTFPSVLRVTKTVTL